MKRALGARPQQWLAEELGVHTSWVNRVVNAKKRSLTLDDVTRMEDALRLVPGTLFRAAGLILHATTVREAIESDPELGQKERRVLIQSYETLAAAH